MRAVGIDYDIVETMFDYTWEFFDEVEKAMENGDTSDAVLLDAMNEENKSNSIVYHFKVSRLSVTVRVADIMIDDDQLLHAAAVGPLRSLPRDAGPTVLLDQNRSCESRN
jgi:hypothetical protein